MNLHPVQHPPPPAWASYTISYSPVSHCRYSFTLPQPTKSPVQAQPWTLLRHRPTVPMLPILSPSVRSCWLQIFHHGWNASPSWQLSFVTHDLCVYYHSVMLSPTYCCNSYASSVADLHTHTKRYMQFPHHSVLTLGQHSASVSGWVATEVGHV